MRMLLVFAATILIMVQTAIGQVRTVSDLHITLEEWTIVPTLIGTQVESFVALRDPDQVIGDNVTAVWFLRIDDRTWQAYAWHDQDNYAAIAHIKGTLGLNDLTDANWPIAEAQQGIDITAGSEPGKFATGVFKDDPFAPIIDSMPEPGALIESLDTSGWSAAKISIWTRVSDCTQNEIISTMAAMVEADLATSAGGALLAGFTVPQIKCDEWISLSYPLNSNGTWTATDLSSQLEALSLVDPADAWQSVAPGSVFTGPQTIAINGGGVDADGVQFVANRFVITLKDVTPPSASIVLAGTGTSIQSPLATHQCFVAPASISVAVAASDNVDVAPSIVTYANGSLLGDGHTITSVGFHTVVVDAIDSSGNTRRIVKSFEIRDRMLFGPSVHVSDVVFEELPGNLLRVAAHLRMTSTEFDVKDIHPDTLRIRLLADDGEWLFPSSQQLTFVDYEDCYLRVGFELIYAEISPPDFSAQLVVHGRGEPSTGDRFHLAAMVPAVDSVGIFIPPCDDDSDPPPPPPPPCEWVEFHCSGATSCLFGEYTPWSDAEMSFWATCSGLSGSGRAWISFSSWPTTVAPPPCAITHSGVHTVEQVGSDCCNECSINVSAAPAIAGTVRIDPAAHADIGGVISVATQGVSVVASGSVTLSDDGGGQYVEGPYGIPIPIEAGQTTGAFAHTAALNQTFDQCSLSVTVATALDAAVSATCGLLNGWTAFSEAEFTSGTAGLTITPTTTDCPDVEPIEPIVIDLLPPPGGDGP